LLFEVMQVVFAQTMTLAWRLGATGVLSVMGAQTPGDDYHRFIPLLQLVPDWYVAAGFIAGALILASGVQLLRRRPSAVFLFLAGIVVGIVAEAMVHMVPGYNDAARQVFEFKDVRTMRDMVIPMATMLMPVLVACGLWLATRGTRPRAGAAS
jgi:ABC-type cobalamin transport system permease subunit